MPFKDLPEGTTHHMDDGHDHSKSEGFSDFMRNASFDEKKKVFKEAAKKANEEQRKVVAESEKCKHYFEFSTTQIESLDTMPTSSNFLGNHQVAYSVCIKCGEVRKTNV